MRTRPLPLRVRVAAAAMLAALPFGAAAQSPRIGFDPGHLIPDASFADMRTFGGPEGVQGFLESKQSALADESLGFLAMLGEPSDPAIKAALGDPEPNLGRLRTAAELVWDASRASGLNPQVILVTLQKEQGLVGPVDRSRLPRALSHAMGFDCPDASGCGNLFPTFYAQLFGNLDTDGNRYLGAAKSLMKSYATPGGRGPLNAGGMPARVGETVTLANTLGGYEGIAASQDVTLGNLATAALYRYTPHVFNGNYNFWNFFTSWFKYANGTLLRSTTDGVVSIIEDGMLRRVPAFVAVARGLHVSAAMPASPTELSGYPVGGPYAPTNDTTVSLAGSFFVFEDGVRHPASSFVLTQRKLDPALIMPISADDAALFPSGTQLTPADGSIVRGKGDAATYLVVRGALKRYSDLTLKQFGAAKKAQEVPAEEIPLYPKDGFVPPKDGTLVKAPTGDGTYVMGASRRLPLTAELFANNRYKAKDVFALGADEIASIPVGPPAPPRQGTWFSTGKELYLFKNGTKHPIFPFVAKQRGITPDYVFETSVASSWPDGIAVPPRDRTLVKAASVATVYVTEKGQLRALADAVFKLRKYKTKNVATMGDAEVDALAKDGFATPPENTYFSVGKGGDVYVFKGGVKRRIYPFVMKQRGMTPDVAIPKEAADDWDAGQPVAPRNGTLVRGDASTTVFLTSAGSLRPLSDAAFARRGYKAKNVLVVPQADLDGFPKGDPIAK